jgi:hypothetical protein
MKIIHSTRQKNSKMTQTITARDRVKESIYPTPTTPRSAIATLQHFYFFTSRLQRKFLLDRQASCRISAHYSLFAEDKPRHTADNRIKCVAVPRRTFSQLYEYAVQNMTHPVHL